MTRRVSAANHLSGRAIKSVASGKLLGKSKNSRFELPTYQSGSSHREPLRVSFGVPTLRYGNKQR